MSANLTTDETPREFYTLIVIMFYTNQKLDIYDGDQLWVEKETFIMCYVCKVMEIFSAFLLKFLRSSDKSSAANFNSLLKLLSRWAFWGLERFSDGR